MKKGDISINVIIIAVISLMVLVVLLMIFSGKMGDFIEGTERVQSQTCNGHEDYRYVRFGDNCPDNYVATISSYSDVPQGYRCCLPDMTTR